MDVDQEKIDLKNSFNELTKDLNIDPEILDETYLLYDRLKYGYSFEGNNLQWLMCLLFIIEQKNASKLKENSTIEQFKTFSLTKLLRMCNLSLQDFFKKIHKLHQIVNYPNEYCIKMNKIQSNFNISSIVFHMFEKIFSKLFKINHPNNGSHITNVKLYNFTWLLFIYVKERCLAVNGDLLNSFCLLLCCINLIYLNVYNSDAKSFLINENYLKHLIIQNDGRDLHTENNALIDDLCQNYNGNSIDTKTINEHYFKSLVRQLIRKDILVTNTHIDQDNSANIRLIDLIDGKNYFEKNEATLNALYDQHVLNFGEMDERVFCKEYGTLFKNSCKIIELNEHLSRSMKKLENLLDKSQTIDCVINIIDTKCLPIHQNSLVIENYDHAFIRNICDQVRAKFYEIFVNILTIEKKRLENVSIDIIVNDETFIKSLFAYSIETVNFLNDFNKPFPFSIDLLGVHSFSFIKFIEIFIRSEENISQDLLRHFNFIEEQILDSKSWSKDSPLWKFTCEQTLPTFEDVNSNASNAYHMSASSDLIINLTPNPVTSHVTTSPSTSNSPVKHPAITRVVCSSSGGHGTINASTTNESSRIIKKIDSKNTIITTMSTNSKAASTSITNSIQLKQPERIIIAPVTKKTNTVLVQVQSNAKSSEKAKDSKKKLYPTSIKFFFRKFYLYASARLTALTVILEIQEVYLKKLWNIFQFSITHCSDLMRDRHLDQLLLCAIYITCKTHSLNIQFQHLIKAYRLIPHSQGTLVRQVLIRNDQHGDIIQFYNEIYIKQMKAYVHLYVNSDRHVTTPNLHLSPVPKSHHAFTPRKILNNETFFISPSRIQMHVQRSKLVFRLNKSPQRSLAAINEMIKRNETKIKSYVTPALSTNKRRLLSDSENDDEPDSSSSQSLPNQIQQQHPKITIVTSSSNNFTKKLHSIAQDRTVNLPFN